MSSKPVASASPETDARASSTLCLQPPSASLVLWCKPRNPPSVAACALNPGVDATAAARPKLLHGNSPLTLDARVPATKDQAHDHTARLSIQSSQPGVSTAHSSVGPFQVNAYKLITKLHHHIVMQTHSHLIIVI